MRTGNWRLFLGAAWLLAAAALFLRDDLLPEEFLRKFRGRNLSFGAWMAVVLAGWNLSRWYQTRPRYAARNPLRPRRDEATPYEYNPDLDFVGMERAKELQEGRDPVPPGDAGKTA